MGTRDAADSANRARDWLKHGEGPVRFDARFEAEDMLDRPARYWRKPQAARSSLSRRFVQSIIERNRTMARTKRGSEATAPANGEAPPGRGGRSSRIGSRRSGREPVPLRCPRGAGRRRHLRIVHRRAGLRAPPVSSSPSVARETSRQVALRAPRGAACASCRRSRVQGLAIGSSVFRCWAIFAWRVSHCDDCIEGVMTASKGHRSNPPPPRSGPRGWGGRGRIRVMLRSRSRSHVPLRSFVSRTAHARRSASTSPLR